MPCSFGSRKDFVWHSHPKTDEAFLVVHGQLRIDFRDGSVTLNSGEMLVVPKGVEHRPFAKFECHGVLQVARTVQVLKSARSFGFRTRLG